MLNYSRLWTTVKCAFYLSLWCLHSLSLGTKWRHRIFDLSDRVLEEEIKRVNQCVICFWKLPKMDDQVLDRASINCFVEFEDKAESVGEDWVAEGNFCWNFFFIDIGDRYRMDQFFVDVNHTMENRHRILAMSSPPANKFELVFLSFAPSTEIVVDLPTSNIKSSIFTNLTIPLFYDKGLTLDKRHTLLVWRNGWSKLTHQAYIYPKLARRWKLKLGLGQSQISGKSAPSLVVFSTDCKSSSHITHHLHHRIALIQSDCTGLSQ